MGRRLHLCACLDCEPEEDPDRIDGRFASPPYFYVKMEWMEKSELLDHIEKTVCPNCGGSNWRITDHSTI